MSQARVFTLLGDSNIHRHVNKTSLRANPAMKASQILTCGNLSIFSESLAKVRPESNACIVSCLSNFLSSAEGPDVNQRIDPILSEIKALLDQVCSENQERFYLISPPMYRTSPVWYREGLPEIMTRFSQTMVQDKPKNMLLLPSFPTPSYVADGVHLTPFSGLEFLMYLFDSSEEAITNLAATPEASASRASEGTRLLEDRMMAMEQDHRRLNQVIEDKIAIDAEVADFHANERMQDGFIIAGLDAISSDLFGKAWQEQAVKDVQAVVQLFMGKTINIAFVKNATPRFKDAEVTYNVQLRDVAEAGAVRDKFGSYFVGGEHRPANLKKFSVRNRITPETKVRIAVLQVLGRRYKTANPNSKVQVIGYDPRPVIKITPASDATDTRARTYNYVEAVKAFPANFTSTELDFIFKKVNPKLCGKLRSVFIVLSDDVYRKRLNKKKQTHRAADSGEPEDVPMDDQSEPSDDPAVTSNSPGPGNDTEISVATDAGQKSSRGKGKGHHSGGSRNAKRGATSSPGGSAPSAKK